jgi:dTDP-4-dehydrorhamnose 3,5-epimerase
VETPIEGVVLVDPEPFVDERGSFARIWCGDEEAKLVRCTRGAIYDVAVDLRAGSPTHGLWHAAELSAENGAALYVPEGCAHGFQTLADDTEVLYLISHRYVPAAATGVRWDDPALGIDWPDTPRRTISERDRSWPVLSRSAAGA